MALGLLLVGLAALLPASGSAAVAVSTEPAEALAPAPAPRRPSAVGLLRESAVRLASGDAAGALELAQRAAARDPESAEARLQLAEAHLRLGQDEAAAEEAGKAVALGSGKAAPHLARAEALTRLGRFAEALDDAEKALALNPGSAAAVSARAAARKGLGRPAEEVLADLARAAELDPARRGAYEEALSARPAAGPGLLKQAPSWALPALGGLAGLALLLYLLPRAWRTGQAKLVRFGSVLTSPPVALEPASGAVVGGRYILGRLLEATDGMAVHEGRDLSDASRSIVRYRAGARWLEKAKEAGALASPAVAAFQDAFAEGGALYLVYEASAGDSLRRLLEKLPGRRHSPEQALRIVKSVCEALEAAHGRGVLHGHLNPAVIVIEKGQVKVRDFGLRPQGAETAYMAPEQEREEAGRESDLFALGACLYEMLTGRLPFAGPEASEARRSGAFAPPSTIVRGSPAGLDAFFARALHPDPGARFHAAPEVFGAFRALVVPAVE